jgi:exodeoxyribonuclease V beta subunit
MHGFVDLLFEHDGRYFILDWKSNYLGNQLKDYEHDNLELAMKEHNYTLQYLVYSLAVHRYLRLKLANYDPDQHMGGVLYYFIRGVRKEQSSGIYYKKVSTETLDILDRLL